MNCYESILERNDAAEAALILVEECRKKDVEIKILRGTIDHLLCGTDRDGTYKEMLHGRRNHAG